MTQSDSARSSQSCPSGPAIAGSIAELEALVRGKKVALVHDWLNGMRGGEKVLEAIAAFFPTAPIYTLFAFEEALSESLRRHEIKTSVLQSRLPRWMLKRYYRYFLPLFPRAIEEFDLTGYDLIVSTSHCVAKGVLPGPEALHLSYCHSPMRYAWDLEHHYFPGRNGLIPDVRALLLSRLRQWDAASCPRVDHFWANSRWVARRIQRYYGRPAEVLAPPVDVGSFSYPDASPSAASSAPQADLHLDSDSKIDENTVDAVKAYRAPGESMQPYALAVSALVPYKKLDLAIRVCEQRDLSLLIVGTGPEEKTLKRLCQGKTQLLGRVDDEELQRLYRNAQLFLQPGVEDFGIAAVEALASGTPVVAVGRGGVCDIVEDCVHGVLYEGFEPEQVHGAIDKFLKIRFNALKLQERARSFSLAQFAHSLKTSIAQQLAIHGTRGVDVRRGDDPQAKTQ